MTLQPWQERLAAQCSDAEFEALLKKLGADERHYNRVLNDSTVRALPSNEENPTDE